MFKTIQINNLLLHTTPDSRREIIVIFGDGKRKVLFTATPEKPLSQVRRLCQKIAVNLEFEDFVED